jgi:hypothetical protein
MITEELYLEKFLQLAKLLTSNSNEIVEKIKFFVANPAEYLTSVYGEYSSFEEDDLDNLVGYPKMLIDNYLWDILYGILSSEKYLIRLDLRTSQENIVWAINSLLIKLGLLKMEISKFKLESSLPSWEVLNRIKVILQNEDLSLAFINDGTDSFPLILINKTDFPELVDTAAEIGLEIKTHFE